jgi:dephospho-CoA kinase
MVVLGLTGSMGMGKSTVTRMLRLIYHIPVWDADQVVRDLWATDPHLIQEVTKLYPQVIVKGKIDRPLLRALAFSDEACLERLEHLVHGQALSDCKKFLKKMQRMNIPLCVLDVPLLFEQAWEYLCTYTAFVYAPSFIQQQRLQRRPYLAQKNIKFLLKRHKSLSQYKALATYEIQTGLSKGNTFRQLSRIIEDMKSKKI